MGVLRTAWLAHGRLRGWCGRRARSGTGTPSATVARPRSKVSPVWAALLRTTAFSGVPSWGARYLWISSRAGPTFPPPASISQVSHPWHPGRSLSGSVSHPILLKPTPLCPSVDCPPLPPRSSSRTHTLITSLPSPRAKQATMQASVRFLLAVVAVVATAFSTAQATPVPVRPTRVRSASVPAHLTFAFLPIAAH